MLHNNHIYDIVVPDICCSKNPTTCTCFFLWSAVRLDPCHHSDTISKFTVSQWEHTSSIVGYHDDISTGSSQRDYKLQSTHNPRLHNNLVNKCGCRSSSHSSPLSETRHVSGCSLLKIHHTNSCQTSRVDLCVPFFFVPCLKQRSETNGEVVYSNRTWVQAKMPTAAAGNCQPVIYKATRPGYFLGSHHVPRRDWLRNSICKCIFLYINICEYIYIYIYTHTHIYIYIFMFIYIYIF